MAFRRVYLPPPNRPRVAALLRELADELDPETATPPTSKPGIKKARSRPRPLTRPAGEAPSHIAAQAERILRDKGFR